jgi:hypothetical protein
MAVEENVTMRLRIRTVPDQMSDVLRQLSKEFVLTDVSDEAEEGEQMLTIALRTPPEDLPSVNVTFFASGVTSPVTPQKAHSLFCNPIYAGLEPLIPGVIDDETWLAATSLRARRDGVEQFLVNMLSMLRTSLGGRRPGAGVR